MKLKIILFFLLSTGVFAIDKPKVCYSHGECQEEYGTELGNRCLLVKIGVKSCAIRCYELTTGSYCEAIANKPYGICVKESFPYPKFDQSNPDCAEAIDISKFSAGN